MSTSKRRRRQIGPGHRSEPSDVRVDMLLSMLGAVLVLLFLFTALARDLVGTAALGRSQAAIAQTEIVTETAGRWRNRLPYQRPILRATVVGDRAVAVTWILKVSVEAVDTIVETNVAGSPESFSEAWTNRYTIGSGRTPFAIAEFEPTGVDSFRWSDVTLEIRIPPLPIVAFDECDALEQWGRENRYGNTSLADALAATVADAKKHEETLTPPLLECVRRLLVLFDAQAFTDQTGAQFPRLRELLRIVPRDLRCSLEAESPEEPPWPLYVHVNAFGGRRGQFFSVASFNTNKAGGLLTVEFTDRANAARLPEPIHLYANRTPP